MAMVAVAVAAADRLHGLHQAFSSSSKTYGSNVLIIEDTKGASWYEVLLPIFEPVYCASDEVVDGSAENPATAAVVPVALAAPERIRAGTDRLLNARRQTSHALRNYRAFE